MQREFDFLGTILRDKGIAQAVDHADAVENGWSQKAFNLFTSWIKNKGKGRQFRLEEFRNEMELYKMITDPPTKKAWGWVAVKAAKQKLIKKIGYSTVTNPLAHNTPATLWEIV